MYGQDIEPSLSVGTFEKYFFLGGEAGRELLN